MQTNQRMRGTWLKSLVSPEVTLALIFFLTVSHSASFSSTGEDYHTNRTFRSNQQVVLNLERESAEVEIPLSQCNQPCEFSLITESRSLNLELLRGELRFYQVDGDTRSLIYANKIVSNFISVSINHRSVAITGIDQAILDFRVLSMPSNIKVGCTFCAIRSFHPRPLNEFQVLGSILLLIISRTSNSLFRFCAEDSFEGGHEN